MAYTVLMSDWNSVGVSAAVGVVQAKSEWMDVTGVKDIVLYVLCTNVVTTAPILTFQTSPTEDETLFSDLAAGVAIAALATPTVYFFQYTGGTGGTPGNPPLAALLRWTLTPNTGAAGAATFRIIASLNPNTMGLGGGGGGGIRVSAPHVASLARYTSMRSLG